MRTQLHHLVAETAARRPDAPALTIKDTTRHLRRAVATRSRAFAAGLRRLGLRPRRAGRGLPRQADRDRGRDLRHLGGRRRRSCRSTRCCGAQQVGHILDRLRRPGAGDLARAARDAARRARPSASRSSTWSLVGGAARARPADAATRSTRGTTFLRRRPTRREPNGDRRRHGGDPLHVGQHRQAQGRGALAPQPDRRRARASAQYLGNHARRRASWPPCRSASTPASASSPPAFTVGAHVVLVNYLLPRDVVRLCAEHRVTGLTCVPPLWIQLAEQDWPAEATQEPALLRQHRRADAEGDARPAARDLPAGQAVPDVRADRGVPLDLPRSGRGRPPARLDRQGDPERRDPRGAPGRLARATRARRASWSTAARWWRWATGTTRSAPPSGSGRRRAATAAICTAEIGGLVRRHRCGATRRASSTSSAARTR